MPLYCVRLPVAGSVGLKVQAGSEEEAIENAFKAFIIVDQIDDIGIYKSLDEHFAVTETHAPFLKVAVKQINDWRDRCAPPDEEDDE
ncbi:MAG TPA: hypothetical protein VMW83_15435 [Spirochaetia bacterium]|nr:hypothetical protein [Spirochaetia bacterium]